MKFLDFFRANKKPSTASVAKERLQIIVAHERGQRSTPDYLRRDPLWGAGVQISLSSDMLNITRL